MVHQAGLVADAGSVSHEDLFPSSTIWLTELLKCLQGNISPALSLTSNFSGAYWLIKADGKALKKEMKRDRNGLSIPARMAIYTERMISLHPELFSLPQDFQVELLFLLYLVVETSSDQIAQADVSSLWATTSNPDTLTEVEDIISSIRRNLNKKVAEFRHIMSESNRGSLLDALIALMIRNTQSLTPLAIYSARALGNLFQVLAGIEGVSASDEDRIVKLDVMKATPSTVMAAVAVLTGYGEALASSKIIENLCNRLISEIAVARPGSEKTMLTLVLLNSCMEIYEVSELPVANNRLVFAVRQITSWFENPTDIDAGLAAESCRALQRLFPCIRDVYGPHWERAIEFCVQLWRRSAGDSAALRLPYLYASLKLMTVLEGISEPNDDLEEALKASAERKSLGVLEVLSLPGAENTQPQEIVDAILCRTVANLPLEHVKDVSSLYGLVASDSRDIQTAAFGLLHKALPAAQQQISVDALLEKKGKSAIGLDTFGLPCRY